MKSCRTTWWLCHFFFGGDEAKKLLAACVAETSLLSAIYWICCSYALLGHRVDTDRRSLVKLERWKRVGRGRLWLDELQAGTVDGQNPAPVDRLTVTVSHYLPGFIHPRWLSGISEPSTVSLKISGVSPQLLFLNTADVRWPYFVLHKPMSLQQWSLCSSPSAWSRAALHGVRRADRLFVGGAQDLRRLVRGLRLCLLA